VDRRFAFWYSESAKLLSLGGMVNAAGRPFAHLRDLVGVGGRTVHLDHLQIG
jgi:hypothetical protein